MRVVSFVIILFLLQISFKSLSQNINIGILAGINASQVSGDGHAGFRKAGILFGGYSNFDVSEEFNVQFEINYSQKGSRRNPKTDEEDTDFFLLRMNYIEVPVMLRYKKKKFIYEAGLYYAQLVGDYLEDENGRFEIPEQLNQLKNEDFGFLLGFDFNLTDHIVMNWRYSNSILPVREYDSGANFWFDSGLMHHYISFSMRYEFIGKRDDS